MKKKDDDLLKRLDNIEEKHNKLQDKFVDDYDNKIDNLTKRIDEVSKDTGILKGQDIERERNKIHRRWLITTGVAFIAIASSVITPIVINKYFNSNKQQQNIPTTKQISQEVLKNS